MMSFTRARRAWPLLALSLVSVAALAQNELRDNLFAQTDDALKAANEARANILAPKNYGDAAEHYRSAEDRLRRGRSLESIKRDLNAAAVSLRKAVEATRLANVTLASAIQARNDAEEANAAEYAAKQWQEAEEKFSEAAIRLENGNVRSAQSRSRDAEEMYRGAELAAIKANYLDEARRLIAQAKDERVDRYAPKTLAKAERLLSQAERTLNENRYDTDEPRSLARQAKYEANHAMYLARILTPVRDRDVTLEDFALSTEVPVTRIAGTLDFVAELDQGNEGPTQSIISKIETLQKDSFELNENRAQILALEAEIQQLEGQLGKQSERLAAQEKSRQVLRQIDAMFGPEEAQVFAQGQNVVIRPIGLLFPSGSSQIEVQYFVLLRKIQDAIGQFPDSIVTVEGHTDSFGSDETNLSLSQQRAEAVREYILANMQELDGSDVVPIGFGESRPVANNETSEGRAKNRRIDLLIRPKQQVGQTGS